VLDCFPVHSYVDTPGEPAAPALVPVGLVHLAEGGGGGGALVLARVLPASPDGSLEEACAAVAGEDTVVLAGAVVGADLAGHVVQDAAGGHGLGGLGGLARPLRRTVQAGQQHPISLALWLPLS